jgi:pimeloyl-ACP methyl ester carboxylesterase
MADTSDLNVRGVKVRLHRAGSGPAVLFLHGAGGVPQWLPFFDALAERYTVLLPEHPGFGGSDDPGWLQQPHPPVWIPSQGSSETVAWASHPDRKYPFLVTFSSAGLVARYHTTYRDKAREYGYEAAAGQLGWACPIYVADSDKRALAEAGRLRRSSTTSCARPSRC